MPVGIVVVSHSAEIARGTVALAAEMAEDVAVVAAGGLDEPGEPLGTDAVRVADAISRANSGDGVLVLMDLGSAVLSAETAVDFVEGDVDVLLCSAPLVEGAVAAAVAAQGGGSLAAVAAEARRGLDGKRTQLADDVDDTADVAAPAPAPAPVASGDERVLELDVPNPLGLHGRPAGRVVRAVSGLDADVHLTDLTNGHGPVPARSLAGLLTLGAVGGHRLRVSAYGAQADKALEALRRLAADGFGDGTVSPPSEPARPDVPEDEVPGATFVGLPAAPGSAYAPVRHLHLAEPPDPDAAAGTPQEEAERLRAAVAAVERDLAGIGGRVAETLGAEAADILVVQQLLVGDDALLGAALDQVAVGTPAGRAWREAVAAVVTSYEQVDDAYQRARVDDVADVGRRVVAALAGVAPRLAMAGPGIVVADVLGPADTAGLDADLVQGVLTASGAPTGHAAILARAFGIPAVVGAGEAVLRLAEEEPVLVDGGTGAVYVSPSHALRAEHEQRRAAAERQRTRALRTAAEPAVTTDGVRVAVEANVGSVADAAAAAAVGADGVGLLRTEFLFLDRDLPPTEDEQAAAYDAVAAALGGAPVTVRTLDIGADKPAPYLTLPREENPFLGVRGVRLGLRNEDLLSTQLRAILRVAAQRPLQVMFPMVTTLAELHGAVRLLDRARAELGIRVELPVGVMVEVPAMALRADAFAEHVDFFSVGTNDLAQYVLAADRGNAGVAELGDACHPAVLGLIERAARAAAEWDRRIAVCGELAGDPSAAALLLGLGVTELSLAPVAIPEVKQAVRAASHARAHELARRALAAPSAADVRALLT